MLGDYNKPKIDYFVSVVWRKIANSLLAYPEFVFLAKIIAGLLIAFTVFTLFRKFFGLL